MSIDITTINLNIVIYDKHSYNTHMNFTFNYIDYHIKTLIFVCQTNLKMHSDFSFSACVERTSLGHSTVDVNICVTLLIVLFGQ